MGHDPNRRLAKEAGLLVAATGLNHLLPGAGPIANRLGAYVIDKLARNRLARLEDFHRRVFEGDVGEHEINERFKAMEDGDFQHLLAAMLSDIEAEKIPIYSAAYIHIVDGGITDTSLKRWWVTAVAQLQVWDFIELADIGREKKELVSTMQLAQDDALQRLRLVGAIEQETRLVHPGIDQEVVELEFITRISAGGEELVKVLGAAIDEAASRSQ